MRWERGGNGMGEGRKWDGRGEGRKEERGVGGGGEGKGMKNTKTFMYKIDLFVDHQHHYIIYQGQHNYEITSTYLVKTSRSWFLN